MAFEITASKRRPQRFTELAGQSFVVSTLMSSIRQERLAHAYLFSGPRGVGKTSAARILAKSLNCETGATVEPCGTCASCHEITAGSALDVIEIDGASNTSVNDVRTIKDEVLFAPNSSRYKIYIIDEVHMLSTSAFNALLKTIEEPPPYVIFIFATTEVHKVPATIRSRCQQFHFQLISLETIKEQLERAAEELKQIYEDEALFWIAKEATGSLRDAYTLFDQIVSFSDGNIQMDVIRENMGLVGIEVVNSLVEALVAGDRTQAIEMVHTILAQGISVEKCIIELTDYFRTILLIQEGITKESILGARVNHFSKDVISALTAEQIEAALDMLLDLYRKIRFSMNQRFELELAISRLSTLHKAVSPAILIKQIESLKQELLQGTSSTPIPTKRERPRTKIEVPKATNAEVTTAISTPPAGGPVELKSKHFEVLKSHLNKSSPALAATLEKIKSWSFENGKAILVFPPGYAASQARDNIPTIRKQLTAILGQNIAIEVTTVAHKKEQTAQNPTTDNEEVELAKKIFRGELFSEEQ